MTTRAEAYLANKSQRSEVAHPDQENPPVMDSDNNSQSSTRGNTSSSPATIGCILNSESHGAITQNQQVQCWTGSASPTPRQELTIQNRPLEQQQQQQPPPPVWQYDPNPAGLWPEEQMNRHFEENFPPQVPAGEAFTLPEVVWNASDFEMAGDQAEPAQEGRGGASRKRQRTESYSGEPSGVGEDTQGFTGASREAPEPHGLIAGGHRSGNADGLHDAEMGANAEVERALGERDWGLYE